MGLQALAPGLQRLLAELNWADLTPIQYAALEPILNGDSCVIEAPTAGGKTEAVLLPALSVASRQPAEKSVRILYIAPLRALLNNLEDRVESYAHACGLEAFKWHGDVSQAAKTGQLRDPAHVLLTTPESLEAILLRKANWRELFRDLSTVIIDEAHSFAAGDRGVHLLSLLERLEGALPHPLQRLALTATVGNPEAMGQWLMGNRPAAKRIHVAADGSGTRDFCIRHFLDDDDFGNRLVTELAAEMAGRRSITFVRSRRDAEDTANLIDQHSRSRIRVRTHHGNVGKYYREEAEKLIRHAGEAGLNSIISTSTLELGIDIGELDAVIQIGSLSSSSSFLQRVGRTGRRAGRPQYFRGYTYDQNDLLLLTAVVSLGLERRSEALHLPGRAFHILAHQLICLSLQQHGIRQDVAWRVLRNSHSFRSIGLAEFGQLVDHMLGSGYLRLADGVLVVGEETEKRYLVAGWRNLFATFNSAPLYDVQVGRTQVGTLDTAFVTTLEVPFVFTLGGKRWQARKVNHESRTIQAVPATGGVAPKWSGFGGPPVPFETAQRAGELVHGRVPLPAALDDNARRTLEGQLPGSAVTRGWKPGSIALVPLSVGGVEVTTYAGDVVNHTLRRLLEASGWKVSGDYASLIVVATDPSPEPLRRLENELERLLHSSDSELFDMLVAAQKPFPFSPFTQMLPEILQKKALVDMSTDVSTLRALLSSRLAAV